ncbi:MAG TPA: ATP-binding protein [bacterium]|nr:ATP-binding protein [bacterium]
MRLKPGGWNNLSTKVVIAVGIVNVIVVLAFSYVSIRTQRQHLISEVVRGASLFSDTVKSSTYRDMLEDRRQDAYLVMETIGRQEGIEKVRIFNKEGKITFSTSKSEINELVDKQAEACYACHGPGMTRPAVSLVTQARARIYEGRNGNRHRILGMITPIYNEKSCYTSSCHVHPASQRVLGVVDIGISLADIDREIGAIQRRTAVLAAGAVLLISLLVWLLVRHFVGRPVQELVMGTQRIAEGDLDHMIPVDRSDEMGSLAEAFNRMTRSLKRAHEDLQSLMEKLEEKVRERTRALEEAQAQLVQSEKLASLGKLAASIAHEINNPLSGILTYAKLMIRQFSRGQPDEKAVRGSLKNLSLIERETQRCSTIVRNLLDFSRQRDLSFADVDVNQVIEEALSLLGNQLIIQEIHLQKNLSPLPTIQADFAQLRQAFLNVIMNACEAMDKGGSLTIESAPEGEEGVQVRLTDTGVGIPPEILSKIFDPFFTTKEKGTGLGLSVVYGIIERHGGKLEIQTEPGRGTTMIVHLPVSRPGKEQDEESQYDRLVL